MSCSTYFPHIVQDHSVCIASHTSCVLTHAPLPARALTHPNFPGGVHRQEPEPQGVAGGTPELPRRARRRTRRRRGEVSSRHAHAQRRARPETAASRLLSDPSYARRARAPLRACPCSLVVAGDALYVRGAAYFALFVRARARASALLVMRGAAVRSPRGRVGIAW